MVKQVLYDNSVTKNEKKMQSTNMDNKLKSVPQRKLLRDDSVYTWQIGSAAERWRNARKHERETPL